MMMRDRLAAGCSNSEVKRKLLVKKTLTYAETRTLLEESDNIDRALEATPEVMFFKKQRETAKPKIFKPEFDRRNQHSAPNILIVELVCHAVRITCVKVSNFVIRNVTSARRQGTSKVCRSVSARSTEKNSVSEYNDLSSDSDSCLYVLCYLTTAFSA